MFFDNQLSSMKSFLMFNQSNHTSYIIYIYIYIRKLWYPQIINFNRVFHDKPSILGYHHLRKHPYNSVATFNQPSFPSPSFPKKSIFRNLQNHQLFEIPPNLQPSNDPSECHQVQDSNDFEDSPQVVARSAEPEGFQVTLMTAREGFAWGAAFTNYAEVGEFGVHAGEVWERFFFSISKGLGGGFKCFLVSPLPGEMIQF